MGRIRKHDSWGYCRCREGRWQAFPTDPKTGEYDRPRTFDTEGEAVAWGKLRNAELRTGAERTAKAGPTIRSLGDDFLASLRMRDASPEHIANISRIIDRAEKAGIGRLDDKDVVRRAVRFITDLKRPGGGPASVMTRNCHITALRSIGNYAVKLEALPSNPFNKLDRGTAPAVEKEVWELEELRRMLDPKHAPLPFYRQFASMIFLGLRQSEAAKLDWSWFRWEDKYFSLPASRKPRASRLVGDVSTKTGHWRPGRIQDEFAAIIRAGVDPVPTAGQIFPEYAGLDRSARQRRHDDFVEACGVLLGNRTPHSCRHTWTCLMLASGEQQDLVQMYAGHNNEDMRRHYGRQQFRFIEQVRREGWKPGQFQLLQRASSPQSSDTASKTSEAGG